MNNSATHSSSSGASFRVTLIGSTPAESADLDESLHRVERPLKFETTRAPSAAASSYPAEIVHAIVFTPAGLAAAAPADVDAVRSATRLGTCRVYLLAPVGSLPQSGVGPIDDFIQRTLTHTAGAVADQVIAFFQEADDLNRRSTLLDLRDRTCLNTYQALKLFWPLSYFCAALHILNSAALWAGHSLRPGALANPYLVTAATFFGVFFVVHAIYVIFRNALFGTRVAKRLGFGFAWHAGALGMAAVATAYSIAAVDKSTTRIIISSVLAVGAYLGYLYARRIRAECTSVSELQVTMADANRRSEVLKAIGDRRLGSHAFPLLPFRSKALFISYMHGSAWSSETADLIHRWTVERGLGVFLDRSSIPSGTLWRQSLLRFMSECGYFVAVLDGEAAATEWVLAESAYAATLRKSIGKPRILLVVRNAAGLSGLQRGPFGTLYRDLFELRSGSCPGAAILVAEQSELSPELILRAIEEVQPMCLLQGREPHRSYSRDVGDRSASPARSDTVKGDIELADRSWRTSVLLFTLFEGDGSTRSGAELLARRSIDWLRSSSSARRTIALNTLRGLIKGQHLAVAHTQDLSSLALNVFISDASLPVKLAALDLLGSMKAPNPVSRISVADKRDLSEFRSTLMSLMNASQRAYAADGVRTDAARELSGKTHREAMISVMSGVDSAG